ncbi:MAG: choice-of-anchor Q domain-containing protein [Planctomycetota bacterium]
MLVYGTSSNRPILTNCLFSSNSASKGGAISCIGQLPPPFPPPPTPWRGPIITNCIIRGNSAIAGAGIYNSYIIPILSNCTLSGNSAGESGGGIHNTYHANIMVTNCTFSGNSAKYDGGGMANRSSNPTLTNCILWNNTAPTDPQISGNGTVLYSDVEGGWPGEGNIDADPYFVQPGYLLTPPFANEPNPADGAMNVNLIADLSWTAGYDAVSHDVYFGTSYPPPFIINQISTTFDPGTMAYNTTYYWRIDEVDNSGTIAGDIWRFTTIMGPPPPPPPGQPLSISAASYMNDIQQYIWIEGDYHLLAGSPCIDAGDPNYVSEPNETDLDGRPRIMDGRIDMGAYEYMPSILVEVRIVPRTINLASKGNWITCYIWLPEQYNVADIEPNSVFLEGQIQSESLYIDEQQQVAIAKFSREELQGIVNTGEVELTISGQLKEGTIFEGTDLIKVIDEGRRKN